MTPEELEQLRQIEIYKLSLAQFSRDCLQIRTKTGAVENLHLNKVQRKCHEMLEAQRKEKGYVRAMILKGRQPGISTYVAARYYRRATLYNGTSVYILSHEQTASDKLFAMVDRYQRFNPLAPHVGAANAKELLFDRMESSYTVATAGQKAGGRGGTVSHFHGSEVAYWANAPDHFAASIQSIPLLPDTEIILESTSAGAGGEFYERCLDAQAGIGDYILVFLPWFLSDAPEYQREPEAGFELSNVAEEGQLSEQEYQDFYQVSTPQMCWRRSKIQELRSLSDFQREYPAEASEAWTTRPGMEPFISPQLATKARKRPRTDAYGPLILGVDPASNGGDRFSISGRRSYWHTFMDYRVNLNTLEGTHWVKHLIDTMNPVRVNIDAGSIGAAIITNLKSMGPRYANVVRSINFGATSQAKLANPKSAGPDNRRAEMWDRMREWLELPEGVQLIDDGALQTDLTAPRIKPQTNNDFKLESKVEMKKRRLKSPDLADALALTFASKEYFTDYQDHDTIPQVKYGSAEHLQRETSSAYVPPHAGGPTGWMG